MGENGGFLKYKCKKASRRPISERLCDFSEIKSALSKSQIRNQAARCMNCGVPFCHGIGCNLANLIPEFNDLVYMGDFSGAWERLQSVNPFPEITARVCPAMCEDACTLSINDEPVSIKDIELFVIEEAFKRGLVTPRIINKESGLSVAVVGSGPAGLSAAAELRGKGHKVTVFDKSERIGGLLRFGIPDFKLNKEVLDRRLNIMKKEGINFTTSCEVGKDVSLDSIRKEFNALLITSGASEARDIKIPGRKLKGIYFAMQYLKPVNEYVSGRKKEDEIISAKNKHVLVIGGGDTGADCASTALRQGAKSVLQAEIMPEPPSWDKKFNPEWPYKPYIQSVSSADEEGARRIWSVLAKRFYGKEGEVKETEFVKLKWEKNKSGSRFNEIPGSKFKVKSDIVFLAMGFVHVKYDKLTKALKLQFNRRGNIKTNNDCSTSAEGVFAAGDAKSGPSLVVSAIESGKKAAEGIDNYFKGKYKKKEDK
ncbi:MAG: glutamate synthase subunit beta [Elusimicrobiota bacterium]